jgi:crotonobetainyl-CoA:carnitine CoA-transferase CaiB-like acyl-CoA transferase
MADTDSLAGGLRVLEIGESITAALVGMVLADYGADVLVVEPPSGSRLRQLPAFRMWARGKRLAALDLAVPAGQRRVAELAGDADVAIVALEPATADRLAVGEATLRAGNARLVHCEVTGFGRGHPLSGVPGHEGIVAARAGRAHEFAVLFGGERPAFPAVPVASYGAAMLALQGVFAALVERERTGSGQAVSTSLLSALGVFDLSGWAPGADRALRLADVPMLFYTVARSGDGVWLQFSQNSPRLFRAFLGAIGLEDLLTQPRFRHAPRVPDPDDARELRALLLDRIGQRSWKEWQEVFAAIPDVSAEPFAWPGEALAHPQLVHTGDSSEVPDPDVGHLKWLGPLVTCSATPAVRPTVPANPADGPGPADWATPTVSPAASATVSPAASATVSPAASPTVSPAASATVSPAASATVSPAASATVSPAPSPTRSTRGTTPVPTGGLLQGITVLELATWIATPMATALLAELGARVIKIEPFEGDPMRQYGPAGLKCVQGKESIALDLKTPEGREIVHRLARGADVLLHNYRPGVPERLGIDYETVRALNRRLVYLYAASYGSTGPMSARPAFHVTAGAICGGALAQSGADGAPGPDARLTGAEVAWWSQHLTRCNESNPDFNAALAVAAAVTMALYARERTGEGQSLETRMMLSNAYTLSEHFVDFETHPGHTFPDRGLHGLGALYRLYPAREGWVFVAAAGQRDFVRLCHALGTPGLAEDARFADAGGRARHDADLTDELAAAFRGRHAHVWEEELTALGVGCVEVHDGPHAAYIFDAPWAERLGFSARSAASGLGPYRRYGRAVRSTRDLGPPGAADRVGAQSRSILSGLGYDDGSIDKLVLGGVVAEAAG